MKPLTHQQAQEILQAGQEVTEPVRESLAQHLAACADCRAYAALVDELAQVVPALYPPASLSEQAVRQKAAGKLPLVRRKSMMYRAITGTRAVVWAGIMLVLFLVAVILIPKMMVNETGGVVQTATGTPASQIEIPAQSELFRSLIWDHQPDLGYVMLRPTNWISQEHGTAARSYIPDAGPEKDNVTLLVTNYQKSAKSLPQGGILVQWELFQDNRTLDGWTQALEASWERSNTRYQIEYETDRAKIYFLQIAPGGNGLVAYIVDQGQPFSVALDLRGDIADADQIKEAGIVTDLVTIVDSFNNETGTSLTRSSTPLPPTLETAPPASPPVQPTTDAANTVRIISPDGRFAAVYQHGPGLLRIEDVQSGQIQVSSFSGVVSPGNWSPDSRYLLFWDNKTGSASIQADGLPLWALDVGTGEARLISTTLVNPEYQSWLPDGSRLAFTNGGYRSAQVEKWLSIFNVSTGQVRDLIPKETLVPGVVDWSPDGKWIAAAAIEGGKTGPEHADDMGWDNPAIAARRVYLVDPMTGDFHRLTQGEAYEDAPRWSEDGKQLRFVQMEGTQARLMVATLETGAIEAVPGCEIPIPPSAGYYGQVDWSEIYSICDGNMTAITPQPYTGDDPNRDLSCTWNEIPLDTLSSGQEAKTGETRYTYMDAAHGFQFRFPADWTITQCDPKHPHFLQLRPSGITGEDIVLSIGVRLDSEDVYVMRTGVGSGDIIQQGTVQFLGQQATRDVLIEEGKTKSVLYDLGKEITRGSLVVTLALDHSEYRKDADLSPEVQAAADQIVQSFAFAPRANLTNEFELYFYRPLVVDYDPAVWEDRSEPDNKEMMVNYLQHRERESCTIGARRERFLSREYAGCVTG